MDVYLAIASLGRIWGLPEVIFSSLSTYNFQLVLIVKLSFKLTSCFRWNHLLVVFFTTSLVILSH